MAIIVSLNPNTSTPSYYDTLSGISLTRAAPTSGDLSSLSASQFAHIEAAVNDGILVVTQGVLPSITGGPNPVTLVGANYDQLGNLLVSTAAASASSVTLAAGSYGTTSGNPLYISGSITSSGSSSVSYTYKSSPPTLTNNQTTSPLVDSLGNALVNFNAGFGSSLTNPLYVSDSFSFGASGSAYRGLDVSIKKNSIVLTTTPLGAGGVYTSPWIDTMLDNSTTVNLINLSNVTGSFVIQETNDTTNASLLIQIFPYSGSFNSTGGVNYRNPFQVSGRYWRVIYTNSSTAQTSFEIAYSTSGVAPVSTVNNPQAFVIANGYGNGGAQTSAPNADSVGTNETALAVQPFSMAFNGSTWDRVRTVGGTGSYTSGTGVLANAVFGQYNTTAPTPNSGNYVALQADSSGNLKNSPLGKYLSTTLALTANQTTQLLVDQSANLLTSLHDPLLGYGATVAQFHVADNTSPGGTGYGILTGGVAQLRNPLGNLDRQTSTGQDNVPAVGISTGAQQLASPITVTSSTSVTAGSITPTITVSSASGTNRGAAWNIQKGTYLILDYGNSAKQETVLVTSVSGSNVTLYGSGANGSVLYAHSGTWIIQTFAYNQARDATTADGSTGAGFAAGATFLYNSALNSGAGGWESERSANGELDGGTGAGAAIAVGYEYNSGGPGGGNYDRERNIQGKGKTSIAITSGGTQGSTSVTLASSPLTLPPGSPILFSTGVGASATYETAYVSSLYTTGANPVTLSSGLVNAVTYITATFDTYSAMGPGLAGLTPYGMGIEEDVVYDPVSNAFYLERAATQDEVSGQNVVMENDALYNSATGLFDRATGSTLRGADVSLKKNAVVLTTTPLAASATYTGPWIDTTLDNTTTVDVQVYASGSSLGNSFIIQEINDTSGGLGSAPVSLVSTGVNANNLTRLTTQVTSRYWRVLYTNNTTAQTYFEIAYTTSAIQPVATDNYGTTKVGIYSSTNSAAAVNATNSDGVGAGGYGLETQSITYAYNGTSFDRLRKSSYAAGPAWNTDAGSATVPITASGTGQAVKASAGQLCRVLITSAGTTATNFYDNATSATGTIIGALPATTTVGSSYTFLMPAANGIWYANSTTGPGITVSYF